MPVAVKKRKNAGPMSTVYWYPAGSYTHRSQPAALWAEAEAEAAEAEEAEAEEEEERREELSETLFISSIT